MTPLSSPTWIGTMTYQREKLTGQPPITRVSYHAIRFLAWSNGAEAIMALLGLAYAVGFWIFGSDPRFTGSYPLGEQMAWVIGFSGFAACIGLNRGWRPWRIASSVVSFMAWGMLAIGSLFEVDIPARSCLFLTMLAMCELAMFIRLHLGLEGMRDTIDAAALANQLHLATTGTPLPAHDSKPESPKHGDANH